MSKLKSHLSVALKAHLEGKRVRTPEGGSTILKAFLALSRARSYGPNGPNPISWQDLSAWSQIMRVPIEPHHAEIIMELDDVWMTHALQRDAAPEGVKTLPPVSDHPISAALLDVMMG